MSLLSLFQDSAEKAISSHVFPGCVVGFVTREGDIGVFPFGRTTYENDSPEVRPDTIYDVASITKSIPTGSLALQLVGEGALDINAKLIDYLPEFDNSDRENILIKHLLTYTVSGCRMASLIDRSAEEMRKALLSSEFANRPGEAFKYSNLPAALLGFVIERITGNTIDHLAEERLFNPLGMKRTTFHPELLNKDEIAPTEIDDWRGLVHGFVHDESAYVAKREGIIMGHAGLFSTAPDILNFLEMLLNDGSLSGRRYFSEDVAGLMEKNQIAHLNGSAGLGWELNRPHFMGEKCSPRVCGKAGFTGTVCVCDREKGVAWLILSNRTFPKRSADSSAINSFRKEMGDLIYGNLSEDALFD